MKRKVDWFRVLMILGGGGLLVYFLIKLGQSPASLFIP